MRVLSIDWGEKRVGLAMSEDGVFAFPLTVVNSDLRRLNADLRRLIEQQIEVIRNVVIDRRIEKIILGWPIGLSGQETDKTKEVEMFYQELLKLGVSIEKIDERYSTKMVPREGRGLDMKDAVSAQILLQEYLDRNKFV